MDVRPIVRLGRRLVGDTFIDTCVIADRTEVADKTGGKKAVWKDRLAETPGWGEVWGKSWGGRSGAPAVNRCRFTKLIDDEPRIETGQVFGAPTAVWTAPLGVKIAEGDRITNLVDHSKWIITSILTVPSEMAVFTRCGIRRAEKGEVG